MTREEILNRWNELSPIERNAWIAQDVMGYEVHREPNGYPFNRIGKLFYELDDFANDITAAFEVINKMREKGYDYAIESLNDSLNAGGDLTHVRFFKRLEGDYYEYDSEVSVMHGISICALLAVLGEKE